MRFAASFAYWFVLAGVSVSLAAMGGLVASSLFVNSATLPKTSREVRTAPAQETVAQSGSKPLSHVVDRGDNPNGTRLEMPRLSGRRCVDFDGNTFGWDWANVPFGVVTCGDANKK